MDGPGAQEPLRSSRPGSEAEGRRLPGLEECNAHRWDSTFPPEAPFKLWGEDTKINLELAPGSEVGARRYFGLRARGSMDGQGAHHPSTPHLETSSAEECVRSLSALARVHVCAKWLPALPCKWRGPVGNGGGPCCVA